MKNIFYFRYINAIGGIESFFYYLAKKYKDWDITIYYMDGDKKQIERLKKYVRVKKYKGEHIVCEKAFFNFNLDIIDNVEAKEYIQIAHGDYKAMGIMPNTHPKLTKYLGVSKQVCDTYKEVTGHDTQLVYNPIEIEKPKKVLNLISATRLTKEKGKDRMIKLMELLDNAKIPYLWTIFTDDRNVINNPNVAYMKPRLDIINYIANADYLVQLSDNEGYCYSVIESLLTGTPVIVTECPVFKELGVKDGENGWVVDFKMSNVDVEKIYNNVLKFNYEQKESNWDEILVKGESTYKEELEMKVKVQAIINFSDVEDGVPRRIGDVFECSKDRADYLLEHNAIKVLEEIKPEPELKKVTEIKNAETGETQWKKVTFEEAKKIIGKEVNTNKKKKTNKK